MQLIKMISKFNLEIIEMIELELRFFNNYKQFNDLKEKISTMRKENRSHKKEFHRTLRGKYSPFFTKDIFQDLYWIVG